MSTTGTNAQGYISVPIPGTANLPNVSQPHFVEATVPKSQQIFPVRTFKVFGGIQIGLGILLGILSTISVVLDAIDMNNYDDCINNYNYVYYYDSYWGCRSLRNSHSLFAFDLTCLICSGWFVLTGFLPMCMSRKRVNSWRSLKIGFMVCCIIGASVFTPVVFSLGVVGSILRSIHDGRLIVLSAFVSVLTIVEMAVAIIAASYCCCCSSWGNVNQPTNVVYLNTSQPGLMINLPQSEISMASGQQLMMATQSVQIPRAQQYQVNQSNPTGNAPSQAQVLFTDPPAYKE